MSFQKKSLILQELEQAIKKKAQQKSRNKDTMSRVIQGSIEKKKNVLKTATNKDNRISSIHKNSQTASKQNLPDKPVSIFNNEHLTVFESSEFKAKKYNNRRLDKLVSLIQYMISSSEKALRYISSTNFEAEFALKLYRSDRENLANELKNLNFEDIIDSQRHYDKGNNKQDQTFNVLLEQNNQLKKQILILEKQAESYHNKMKEGQSAELKHLQKENGKLKEMLRKLIPFDHFKQIVELLQKQNKFQVMAIKCQENSKKTTEIEIVISSLENERSSIVDNLTKAKQRNDKHYKLSEIQAEKQQLQKELNQMKIKLADIIDSGKSLSELEMVKKNSELITQKLYGLAKELTPNVQVKRSNEQLIDHIKNASIAMQTKNNQLSQAVSRFVEENEGLKRQLKQLSEEKKELQNQMKSEEQEIRMTKMLSQIQKLRDVVDELDQQQQKSAEKIQYLEEQLKMKEEKIAKLTFQLTKEQGKAEDMEQIMNEVKDEMQTLTHNIQDKEKYYRDKLAKMEQINTELNNQISQINEENEELRANFEELVKRNDSREDSKLLHSEKIKVDYKNLQQEMKNNQANFERQLHTRDERIEQLENLLENEKTEKGEIQNEYNKLENEIKRTKQIEENNRQKLAKLQKNQAELLQQVSQLQGQLDRLRKQHTSITEKLRITQHEIISNNYSKDELKFNQAEKENLQKRLQAANSEVTELKEQIKEIEDELEDKDLLISELEMKLDESKASNKKIQMDDMQTTRQINTLKQQIDFLGKEKESREKLMEQQRQRHMSEYENLNKKLHQSELLNIQLSKEKVQTKEQLEMERENNESLQHKIGILQDEVRELQDQIKSLTLLSSQAQGERQQSREMLSSIEEEKQSLKKELNTTKQQIVEHSQLVQFKNKQYVNLLKQILKGLQLDPMEYKQMTTFEELLEFGSQQVVQIRKRQREEQSNRRKNNKKDYEGELSEFYEPNFEDCKTKLFEDSSALKLFQKKAQVQENIDLQQFGDLKEKSNNNSMISQENNNRETGAELQEFNDLESQKMNDSMLSNDLDQKLPDDIGLHSYPRFDEDDRHYAQQQMEKSEVEEEKHSQFNENISSQHVQEKHQEMIKSSVESHQDDAQNRAQKQDMVASYNPSNNSGSIKMENHSVFFHEVNLQNSDKQSKKSQKQAQNRPYSKHTLLSIALKDEKLDLDEFQEVKSVNDNQSIVSSSDLHDQHREFAGEDKSEGQVGEDNVQLYPIKMQQQEGEMNLQQFQEMDEDPLSHSLLSDRQHEQVNLEDFGEIAQSGLGESMLSMKEEEGPHVPVHLGLDQFAEADDNMNDSMLSQKKEQHGLSQFGQYDLNKMNESLVSQKEEKEHGMSQFGDIQQDRMGDSILSQNLNNLMKSSNSGGANFDDFDELKSQKMSDSMLSERADHFFDQPSSPSPKKQSD